MTRHEKPTVELTIVETQRRGRAETIEWAREQRQALRVINITTLDPKRLY